jgi:hypothetical protein
MAEEKKKGQFTFRTAAVFFILSALFEMLSFPSQPLLFGAARGGVVAAVYHLAYLALFVALGIGLWSGQGWGYPLVFVATAVYTLDRLQMLFSWQALESFIVSQLGGYESALQARGVDAALLVQAVMLISIVVILCWWGFAAYTYLRRDYFQSR